MAKLMSCTSYHDTKREAQTFNPLTHPVTQIGCWGGGEGHARADLAAASVAQWPQEALAPWPGVCCGHSGLAVGRHQKWESDQKGAHPSKRTRVQWQPRPHAPDGASPTRARAGQRRRGGRTVRPLPWVGREGYHQAEVALTDGRGGGRARGGLALLQPWPGTLCRLSFLPVSAAVRRDRHSVCHLQQQETLRPSCLTLAPSSTAHLKRVSISGTWWLPLRQVVHRWGKTSAQDGSNLTPPHGAELRCPRDPRVPM